MQKAHLKTVNRTRERSNMSNIGERIRNKRNQLKLTAKELGEKAGVSEKAIYRIETGEVQDPGVQSLKRIINALDCSADEIIFDVDEFTQLGELRQVFLNAAQLEEYQQDELIKMIRTMLNGYSYQDLVSEAMKTAKRA